MSAFTPEELASFDQRIERLKAFVLSDPYFTPLTKQHLLGRVALYVQS